VITPLTYRLDTTRKSELRSRTLRRYLGFAAIGALAVLLVSRVLGYAPDRIFVGLAFYLAGTSVILVRGVSATLARLSATLYEVNASCILRKVEGETKPSEALQWEDVDTYAVSASQKGSFILIACNGKAKPRISDADLFATIDGAPNLAALVAFHLGRVAAGASGGER
jgi:hypothetical protein